EGTPPEPPSLRPPLPRREVSPPEAAPPVAEPPAPAEGEPPVDEPPLGPTPPEAVVPPAKGLEKSEAPSLSAWGSTAEEHPKKGEAAASAKRSHRRSFTTGR